MGHLLRQLPTGESAKGGELVDLPGSCDRVVAFLGRYHFGHHVGSDVEHELMVLVDRLHFQVAELSIAERSGIRIDYHFLTVRRTGDEEYRLVYATESKQWRN